MSWCVAALRGRKETRGWTYSDSPTLVQVGEMTIPAGWVDPRSGLVPRASLGFIKSACGRVAEVVRNVFLFPGSTTPPGRRAIQVVV